MSTEKTPKTMKEILEKELYGNIKKDVLQDCESASHNQTILALLNSTHKDIEFRKVSLWI